ncbi:MAG: RtcB family protein [Verrucomicrobiaceae bacterium]|nr:RtcB family protein [Verrucomicrobiaceae bacterium]
MQIEQLCDHGSGNHFLEVNRDKNGSFWFSIHCGSRNFGHRICTFHQKKAIKSDSIPKLLWYKLFELEKQKSRLRFSQTASCQL